MAIIQLTENDFQADSFVVEWLNHPAFSTPLDPGTPFTNGNRVYEYALNGGLQRIVVDTSQGNSVGLSVRHRGFFNFSFFKEDSVLLALNTSTQPIMLVFDPPVQSVGTYVGASGDLGQEFWAYQYISLSPVNVSTGQLPQWEEPIRKRATVSKSEGSGAYLGAAVGPGENLFAVGFDVTWLPGDNPVSVAINTLNYKPS